MFSPEGLFPGTGQLVISANSTRSSNNYANLVTSVWHSPQSCISSVIGARRRQ